MAWHSQGTGGVGLAFFSLVAVGLGFISTSDRKL